VVAAVGSVAAWEAIRIPTASNISAPVTADDFVGRGFHWLNADPADPIGAYGDFSRAFRLRPDGRTMALMGYARSKGGYHQDAVHLYTSAIEEHRHGPAWVRNNRAHAILQNNLNNPEHLDRAVAEADVALQLDPNLLAARYNRAMAQFLTHRHRTTLRPNDRTVLDAIERDLAAVLEAHPDDLRTHKLTAQVLATPEWADAARLERAREHLAAAVALGQSARSAANSPTLRGLISEEALAARARLRHRGRPVRQIDVGLAHPPAQ
jgi:hypothetical protein